MVAHVRHLWRTMTYSATLAILELWCIFKRQKLAWEIFFSFFYMNDTLCVIVHHRASLMMHCASLCDHSVGSPLYRGRLQSIPTYVYTHDTPSLSTLKYATDKDLRKIPGPRCELSLALRWAACLRMCLINISMPPDKFRRGWCID